MVWPAGRIINRNAGMQFFDDASACLFDQHVGREGKNTLTWSHDLARRNLIYLERTMNQRLLKLGQHADTPRSCRNQLKLLRRMHSAFMHHGSAKKSQDKSSRPVQQAHCRARAPDARVHGSRDSHRHLVNFAESERFWNQLPQQNMKIGDQRECDWNRNQMGIDISMWNVRQPLLEDGSHDRFADPAKSQTA